MEPNRSFGGITGNLALRQLDEESIDQNGCPLLRVGFEPMGIPNMKRKFHHSISTKVKGDDTFTVPLSKFYDVIDTERLLPDDLASYQSYIEERHRKMIALTFDDGTRSNHDSSGAGHLKEIQCQSYLLYGRKNVSESGYC